MSYVTFLHFQITYTDCLHLLFWQFSNVIDAVVLKHLRHLVNVWHDVFYLILPIRLDKKQNFIAYLYLAMKLYLPQKVIVIWTDIRRPQPFTNFKKWACYHLLGKITYGIFFFFFNGSISKLPILALLFSVDFIIQTRVALA